MDSFAVGLLIGLCLGLVARPLFVAWVWTMERKQASAEADVLRRNPPRFYIVRPSSDAPWSDGATASPGASGAPLHRTE